MDRRTFLACLSTLPLMPLSQGFTDHPALKGYDTRLADFLEIELANNYRDNGARREKEVTANLHLACNIIKPVTIRELAFVVWCGERFEPIEETIHLYKQRSELNACSEDFYPHVNIDEYRFPHSYGLFVFKEELTILLRAAFGMRESVAIATAIKIYRLYCETEPRLWQSINLERLLDSSFPKDIDLQYFNEVGRFIALSFGRTRPYYCSTYIADLALAKLQRSS